MSQKLPSGTMQHLIHHLRREGYEFTTPTPSTHERVLHRPSRGDLRDAFGWNRPFASDLLPRELFDELRHHDLIVETDTMWKSLVRASCVDSDIFLHSGYPTIESDAVFLGPDTYRFCRLIRQVAMERKTPVSKAVDIGCGTGAGGVAIARNFRCNDITWSDISERTLEYSAANLLAADIRNARIVRSDLFADLEGPYDLIVANPPYLNDRLERAYRHGGGPLGSRLSLRIVTESLDRLSPGGNLILYTGSPIVDGVDRFKNDVETVLSGAAADWTYEEIDPDVFGEELELDRYEHVERIAVVALVMTKNEGT